MKKDKLIKDKDQAINCLEHGNFDLVSNKFLSTNFLLQIEESTQEQYYMEVNKKPLIFRIIQEGNLTYLPKTILKRKVLTAETGYYKKTILLELASQGCLHLVAKNLLTKKALLKRDSMGNNCIFYSCQTGEIANLPLSLIKIENLISKNQRGRTSMHQLCQYGHLNKIPIGLVNEHTLLGDDPKKLDPIDELYSYIIAKEKSHNKIQDILNEFSKIGLSYLEKKDYIISHLSTQILRKRNSAYLTQQISKKSKDWELPA